MKYGMIMPGNCADIFGSMDIIFEVRKEAGGLTVAGGHDHETPRYGIQCEAADVVPPRRLRLHRPQRPPPSPQVPGLHDALLGARHEAGWARQGATVDGAAATA